MRQLTFAEIQPLVRGCSHVSQVEQRIAFDRIGPAGRAYYAQNDNWALRTRCPAGVVLDMLTDASRIAIAGAIFGGARRWAYVDAVIDGSLVATIGTDQIGSELAGQLLLPPAAQPRRVSV